MLSEDRKYSGMALKFEENVDEIVLRTLIEPKGGALERPMIFTPGDVALAQMGPNGFVTVHEGSTFNGHVTFLIGKVNQAQEDPTAPNYESETMRLAAIPGYDYPELRSPPTELSLIERIEEALDAGQAVPPIVVVTPTEFDEDGLKIYPEDKVELVIAPETVCGYNPAEVVDPYSKGGVSNKFNDVSRFGAFPVSEDRVHRVGAKVQAPVEYENSQAVTDILRANKDSLLSALNGSAKSSKGAPDHSNDSVPEGFASQVLSTVRDRGSDYGTPAENHQLTADLWSAWLSRRMKTTIKMSAEDVCLLNVFQKLSRLASKTKDDSLLDVSGYVENVAMLRPDQRNT